MGVGQAAGVLALNQPHFSVLLNDLALRFVQLGPQLIAGALQGGHLLARGSALGVGLNQVVFQIVDLRVEALVLLLKELQAVEQCAVS